MRILSYLSMLVHCIVNPVFADEDRPIEHVFFYTIPKSGTHLLWRTCELLYDSFCFRDGRLHCAEEVIEYSPFPIQEDEKYFVLIRDLRNVFISYVRYIDSTLGSESFKSTVGIYSANYWNEISFEEKIKLFITRDPLCVIHPQVMYNYIQAAIEALDLPNVLVVKFEELTSPKLEKRIEVINRIIEYVGSEPIRTPEEVANLMLGTEYEYKNNPTTTYSNRHSQWQEVFTVEHQELFKEFWADEMRLLGYEIGNHVFD